MDEDAVWSAIDDQRRRTADLLEALSDDEWNHPSLCAGWTVRDVAGHLTLQQQSVTDVLRYAVSHPGSLGGLNRMIRMAARDKAVVPVDQLIGEIRGMIGSRRRNVGVTHLETLTDILVHGQDIALPLQRALSVPPPAAAAAATRVWSYLGRGKARVFTDVPVQRFTISATDTAWSAGEGPEIRGPIVAILLLLTGRAAALSQVHGSGVPQLREQLRPA